MKQLARALINAAAFLELSGDDVLDPDAAVKAMEQIAHDLGATECAALASACAELADEARSAGPGFRDNVEFYDSFLENFGVATGRNT